LLHPTVAGLLHPATGQRFIAFPDSPGQHPSEDDAEPSGHSPRCGFTPLEGSHSPAAVPRHRGLLPSCRLRSFHTSLLRPVPASRGPPPRRLLPFIGLCRVAVVENEFPAGIEPEFSSLGSVDHDPTHPDSGSAVATAGAASYKSGEWFGRLRCSYPLPPRGWSRDTRIHECTR
jgi:hypothetical protein